MSSIIIATLPRESARLRFRLLRLADLPEFHRYRSDAKVARLQGWSPMSLAEAESFILDNSALCSLNKGAWFQLAVARKEDDLLVGDVGLWLGKDSTEAEFGLTISPKFQGQGLGSETVRSVIELLFEDHAVRYVRASVDARNTRCLGALNSAQMTLIKSHEVVYKGEVCLERVFRKERSVPNRK